MKSIQDRARNELDLFDETYMRLINPHVYRVSLSDTLNELKTRELDQGQPVPRSALTTPSWHDTLRKMMLEKSIVVDPLEPYQVQPASIDLRLGRQFLKIDENTLEGLTLDSELAYIALEPRIHPSRVLDEEAHPADGAPPLHERGDVRREAYPFDGRGEEERMGGDDDLVLLDANIGELAVQRQPFQRVLVDLEELPAQAQVDGGRLDLVGLQRIDHDGFLKHHLPQRVIREDHQCAPRDRLSLISRVFSSFSVSDSDTL